MCFISATSALVRVYYGQDAYRQILEALLMKQQLGVSSDTLLIESGYSEEDLARMKAEKAEARDKQEVMFNSL